MFTALLFTYSTKSVGSFLVVLVVGIATPPIFTISYFIPYYITSNL